MTHLITVEYAQPALVGVNFLPMSLAVQAGERVAILGPSGAGKSTLIKMMANELRLASGNILFEGQSLAHTAASRLSMRRAVLPQSYDVAFALDTRVIVGLGRIARHLDEQANTIIEQAASMAHAQHLLNKRFDVLSGGEKARVHLARVFAQLWDQTQGLLLVDEPIAALDPGLQLEVLGALQRYTQERGHALVAVLHDMNYALNYFDRLILMRQQQIIHDVRVDDDRVLEYLSDIYEVRVDIAYSASGQRVLIPVGR